MGRPATRKDDNDLRRRRNGSIRHSRSIHGMRPPAAEILRTRSARLEIALSLNTNGHEWTRIHNLLQKKKVKLTRHNVFERDKNTCQYCGDIFDRSELNLDHVVPRDRGGTTTWENVVCSCIACNTRKGNRLPRETHMSLIRKPKRPKWRPFVQITFSAPQHDLWKHFVDLAYWNVELSD